MARRRPVLLLTALMALSLPAGGASAACTSKLPVPDKRVGSYTCTGVHVGMSLLVPSEKWRRNVACGASFAFADQFGNKYLTFPGTCFLDFECLDDVVYETLPPPLDTLVPRATCLMPADSENEPHFKNNKGPIVFDAGGRRVGRITYAVNKDDIDFAIMRVDPGHRLDHSVPVYGGPVRMGGDGGVASEAYVFSPPAPYGVANARTGVLTGSGAYMYLTTHGLLELNGGASVMKPDGSAVGYLDGHLSPIGWVTRALPPAIDRAQRQTRLKLRLLTAPLK